MSKFIGLSFEELDDQEMINIQGGTAVTITFSSFAVTGAISLVSYATGRV